MPDNEIKQSSTDLVGGLQPLAIPSSITLGDLAEVMNVSNVELIKEFIRRGYMLTVNEVVEHEVAASVTPSFGYQAIEIKDDKPASLVINNEDSSPELLESRPPVVTILGHVDHGKTTLLDSIRKANVVDTEAGGITQHIAAYQIQHNNNIITFLDTPGHEAFTAMRMRGAQVTDVAVLVVAADDGIMPQTIEAINHVKAAQVPIIVAINKIDRADANIEKVRQQLLEHELIVEDFGGEVVSVPVSAINGDGVPDLLENILLVAEISELKANPKELAKGVIVESRIDKNRGVIATALVQTGTLKPTQSIIVGENRAKVRAMFDDRGSRISYAEPSQPVEILGLSDIPKAGDLFYSVSDEKTARKIVEKIQRENQTKMSSNFRLQDLHARIESGEIKALNIIIKTDVQGSIDAVENALSQISTDEEMINVIHSSSGSITENDVMLALASDAIILGFCTRVEPGARILADQESIQINLYSIIYQLVDDMKTSLNSIRDPEYQDIIEGRATIRAVFGLGKSTVIGGFYVNEGKVSRGTTVKIIRDNSEIFAGMISSLKHFNNDVSDVSNGLEGGIVLDGFNSYQEGDILECHRAERIL
ncbi:MAG: translation initiation factor IF-2 [Chloroflexi bacterium]|nr:translation initiation factor IF-2 [Chloroflexota bacterium]